MSFLNLKDIPVKTLVPGFMAQFIHSDSITLSIVKIEKGSKLPEHSHIHEQITYVIEGKLEFHLEHETLVLESGMLANIPPGSRHSALALEDCQVIDVFSPVREDYQKL